MAAEERSASVVWMLRMPGKAMKVFQEENDWDCSGGPVVKYLRLLQGVQIRSLAKELRSQIPRSY